jgi:hypothetical protein
LIHALPTSPEVPLFYTQYFPPHNPAPQAFWPFSTFYQIIIPVHNFIYSIDLPDVFFFQKKKQKA